MELIKICFAFGKGGVAVTEGAERLSGLVGGEGLVA